MKRIAFVALCCIMSSCVFVKASGENWSIGNGKKVSGEGNIRTVEYELDAYDAVSLSISADVYYSYSEDKPSVKVTAYENLLPYLKFEVTNGTLAIKTEKNVSIVSDEDIKIYVNTGRLSKMSIAGSGNFENMSPIVGEKFAISVSGSGDANVKNVEVEDFSVSIAGSGDINIDAAVVNSFSASIAGSGDLDAKGFDAGKISASIAGSGDMSFSGKAAEGDFSIAGSGDIYIRNLDIDHYDIKTSGSGSIHK